MRVKLSNKYVRGAVLWVLWMFIAAAVLPQQRGQAPRSPKDSAQVDLTGYWAALITEEWTWRMVTPPKGDYTSVPLNPEGLRVAQTWDLAKDEATGEQCKPFGAAGVMRLPLRVHITWADDKTLKLETDAGQQTRLFNFESAKQPGPEHTWQGYSVAEWTRQVPGYVAPVFGGPPAPQRGVTEPPPGSLKVMTTNLRAGYLRKNGAPYSEKTKLTEYYDRIPMLGSDYMVVTTIVEDPTYLFTPFITTSHFKREPDGSKWNPSPCKTDPPRTPASSPAGGKP